jgi:hypothetical protein
VVSGRVLPKHFKYTFIPAVSFPAVADFIRYLVGIGIFTDGYDLAGLFPLFTVFSDHTSCSNLFRIIDIPYFCIDLLFIPVVGSNKSTKRNH